MDDKDQGPEKQPRRSILVTLVIAAAIALLAGFLAWGVPTLLKMGARDSAPEVTAAPASDPAEDVPPAE